MFFRFRAPASRLRSSGLALTSLAAKGRRLRRLFIDTLESRSLLAAISWDGGGSDLNWNNAANWTGGVLPGSGDDVTINAPGNVTIASSSDVAIHSFQTSNAVTVSAGTFSISGDSQVNAQFTNAGGGVFMPR